MGEGVASGSGGVDGPARAERTSRRWLHWLIGLVGGFIGLVVAALAVFLIATRNPEPGAFYSAPDDLSEPVGTILRSEPFTDGIPAGAEAWKVLYVSTDEHDEPIAVSGLVIAPTDPPPGPRPVLAWAHGTTGIVPPCAPSNTSDPLKGVPDMTGALEQGWVLTLTDYPGLGTAGPHPYLVAQSAGRAVLDSVRAAHALDTGLELDDRYAVWGHSQGGHAALSAGQLADDYLPEYELAGVAALAPATALQDNLAAVEGTKAGNLLTIMAVGSWTAYYPDIPDGTFTRRARIPAAQLAKVCINQPSAFRFVLFGILLPDDILAIDPAADPRWTERLDGNSPAPGGVRSPLFVAQGLVDEIIAPDVTEAWVEQRCAADRPTTWQTYDGVNHVDVVHQGGVDALEWTIARLDGTPAPQTCP